MYENGRSFGVINLEDGDFLCAFYGNIGTRQTLSNGVLEKVLSYFYNKNLPPNTTLLFDYNSELSVALNEYYYFQHDFLYEKVVKKINPGIKHWMACMNAFFWLQQHYGCSPFKTQIKYKCYVILKK